MNIFIESDSSFYEYLTLHRKKRIDIEKRKQAALESARQEEYEDYYNDNINNPNSIFQLRGINIIDFTHKKIKFSFNPKHVIRLISNKVIFYCSIRYVHGVWMIMRNSLPVDIRSIIYSRFLIYNVIHLKDICYTILFIYESLIEWCKRYENFRREKYETYLKSPKEVYLDSEDEELFLTEEEIQQRQEQIRKVLKRMIPPELRSNTDM